MSDIASLHNLLLQMNAKIDKVNDIVARIDAQGCSKAVTHLDHEQRIRLMESADARREGRTAVVTGIMSVVCSATVAFIARQFGSK